MAELTFSIAAADDDNDGYYGHSSYPPESGGTYTSAGQDGDMYAYKGLSGSFYTQVTYLRFDTSALSDDAEITAAILRVHVLGTNNPNTRNLTADWYDFGGYPDTSADFASSGTNALTAVAISAITAAAINDLPLTGLENISKTGYTGLRLHIDGGQPTGENYVRFAAFEHATSPEAQLIVTYNTASTFFGASSLTLTVSTTTAAKRIARGATFLTATLAAATIGRLTVRGTTTVPVLVTMTTVGTRSTRSSAFDRPGVAGGSGGSAFIRYGGG